MADSGFMVVVDDKADAPVDDERGMEGTVVDTLSELVNDVVGDSGLTPALPISTEPNGIPVRAAPPGVVGDVAAMDEVPPLEVVPHAPDVAVLPGIDVPVPMLIPPPSKVVVEPDNPDVALPVVEQGNGLSPGEASCVAPMGIPVGGTCEPGTMPSGEVGAMLGVGLPIPPTWAKAEPQPKSNATAVAITKRVILGTFLFLIGIRRTPPTGVGSSCASAGVAREPVAATTRIERYLVTNLKRDSDDSCSASVR